MIELIILGFLFLTPKVIFATVRVCFEVNSVTKKDACDD
jgi:hypothetical protein